jgi:hypothetical protein
MNSRRVLRGLRSKTALLVLAVLAAVALVVPTLAGALDQPSITSPGAGVQNAGWDKTFTFDTATSPDPSATGYSLLRAVDGGGVCDDTGAAQVATGGPSATTLIDSSATDGAWCYWVQAEDSSVPSTSESMPVKVLYDGTPPPVAIDSSPGANSNDSTPTFAFSSSDGSATFECSVNGGGFAACSSPRTLTTQSDGSHSFAVRAIDAAGNHSSTAASDTWIVDTAAPTASLDSTPGLYSNDQTPSFSFSSSEPTGATFECKLDGAAYAPCSTGTTLASLLEGGHTFAVKAIDVAGNHSTSAASYSWTVDTTAPSLTLGTTPPAFSNDSTPTFAFSSTDGSATFECQIDGGGFSACTTPKTFSTQADGSHTFAVQAIDGATNRSSPATYTWTVDTTPPPVTIDAQPAALSNTRTPTFSFSSSDSGATFECQIDGGGFSACTSPKTLATLTEVTHTFAVRAIDSALNHTVTAASYTWSIDATNPTVPGSFQIVGAGTTRNGPPIFKFSQSSDAHTVSYSLLRDGVDTGASASLSGGLESMTDSNIIGDGTDDGLYHYTVQATDTYGNHSLTGAIVVTIDGGPPSVPANVHVAAALTRSAPVLSWNASTGQPATYRVFRDGVSIGTVTAPATTFSDVTLPLDGTADRAYTYTVAAADAAGNQSLASLGAQVVLDTLRPLPAASLTVTQSPTAAKPVLIWPASGSSDLAGYNVYRGGVKINGALVGTTTFTDTALDGDGSYAYTVRAVDSAGNESADSSGASVLYDTAAPGTPGASAVAAPSGGTATVSWAAAGDAGAGVAAYQVRRSAANGGPPESLAQGTPVCGSVPASARGCADAGLTQGASYRYSVFAIDAVGNVSAPGQTAAISIPSTTDKTPPKAPTALHAQLSNGRITLRWKNPKSDLATVTVVWNSKRAPRTSRDGNRIYHGAGTKVSLKLPKLQAGKLMRFGVFAADRVGNVSVAARATVNVPQPSPVSLAPNGKLSGSPDLTWNAVTGATYYNVQVFEGTQAAKRVGIAWPAVTKYTLPGKDMQKGKVYTWYVWPGIGAKSAAKYGKLIGKVTFTYAG